MYSQIYNNCIPRHIAITYQYPTFYKNNHYNPPNNQKIAPNMPFVINDHFIIIFITDFNLLVYDKVDMVCGIVRVGVWEDERTERVMSKVVCGRACDQYECLNKQ